MHNIKQQKSKAINLDIKSCEYPLTSGNISYISIIISGYRQINYIFIIYSASAKKLQRILNIMHVYQDVAAGLVLYHPTVTLFMNIKLTAKNANESVFKKQKLD